jgi:hypothetical protein
MACRKAGPIVSDMARGTKNAVALRLMTNAAGEEPVCDSRYISETVEEHYR